MIVSLKHVIHGRHADTYGSFMRIKRRHMKNDTTTQTNATESSSIRFSRGVDGLFVWSRITNPSPPIVNRKLDARPSMIYWPLTRYCINATWNNSSLCSKHITKNKIEKWFFYESGQCDTSIDVFLMPTCACCPVLWLLNKYLLKNTVPVFTVTI